MRALLALFGCVLFSGCADRIVCAALGSPGIELSVTDATTHRSLDAEATVTVTNLQRGDSLRGPLISSSGGSSPLVIADNRPGNYRVFVAVPGYSDWVTEVSVTLPADRCAVVTTVVIAAELQRSAGSRVR